MIRTVPVSSNALLGRNFPGTDGKYYGNRWEYEVLFSMHLPTDHCFGKGEAESSNLSGSTSFPANYDIAHTVRVRSTERAVQWRPIPGFEAYHVSNRGDVRRVIPASRGRSAGQCPYMLTIQKIGRTREYRGVTLTRWDGTQKRVAVHQLVCRAFNGKPPHGKTEVNHINGIHDDNRPENLEWCTRSENERHKVKLRNAHMSAGNDLSATTDTVSAGPQENPSDGGGS